MKRNTILIAVGVVVALVGGFVVYTLFAAGAFTSIEPHGPKPSRVIEGFAGGTEDVVFRPNGEEVFVSSANFHDPSQPGHVYLVDVTDEDARPKDVTPDLSFPFQPHGLDLWTDETERLFVVNHRAGSGFTPSAGDLGDVEHTVEVFDVADDGTLKHVATHRGDALLSPNDVAAVGPEMFYATNDHGTQPGLWRTLEDWLRLPLGNVVYFDGEQFHVAYEGTRYANGVIATDDGKQVYVAETTGGKIHRFSRDPDNGALTLVSTSDDYRGPDNLSVDEDGAVWTAAHPKLLTFVAHAENPEERSPTQVLKYVPKPRGRWDVEEIYLTQGNPISAASVAATNEDLIVVGAVFDSRLVVLPREFTSR